jgi:DDE superfamily endonuclease
MLLTVWPPGSMLAAGTATRLPPTITIPGITPERFNPPWSNHGKEGSYKVAVYLQKGLPPCIVPTVPRDSKGVQQSGKAYIHKHGPNKGKLMSGMGGEEAADMLDTYLEWRRTHCAADQAKRFLLILDNDPAHTSEDFKKRCKDRGIDYCFLPPRSHDLSPPDSHFFAVAKNEWRRRMYDQDHLTWPERKQLFRKCILSTKVNPHVADYDLRLKACDKAKGHRFATELAALKSKKARGA